ncbi:unnamed protein product [Arabis nemorensis]|uniref:RING-type domain-containing protein n=1 Tax=Arabis nemorensis TaxID=586526 RepID=A0A565CR00_9BRAS|nr:unnamed protein product [Arabis nemorensis]
MIILSEFRLLPCVQQRLVSYISTESVSFSNLNRGEEGGFTVEVNVNVNVEQLVRIGNCDKENCRVRARREKTEDGGVFYMLNELSRAVSRMKFQCSHVFHRDCVMKWLKKNPSCPICRANILEKPVSLF